MRHDTDGNPARYELQRGDGWQWRHDWWGRNVAALKPQATSLVSDYRIIDHELGMVRDLVVTSTSCLLADGGWKPCAPGGRE